MPMVEGAAPPIPPGDRRTGLIVFGIFEIAIGGFFALMLPFVALMSVLSGEISPETGPTNLRLVIPTLSFYILLAVTFVSLGAGSCYCRRWARTLNLIVGRVWLLSGVISLVMWVAISPGIFGTMATDLGEDVAGAMQVAQWIVAGGLAFVFIVLPAILVLFYRSRSVKATCERRDPHLSWTETLPEPALMLSLGHALLAYFLLWCGAYNWAVPFFGVILTGGRGAAVVLVCVAVSVYLARAMYRQQPLSWWIALGLGIVMTVSAVMTFVRVDIYELYEAMDYPEDQIEMLRTFDIEGSWLTTWPLVILAVIYVGYLLYAKRCFTAAKSP